MKAPKVVIPSEFDHMKYIEVPSDLDKPIESTVTYTFTVKNEAIRNAILAYCDKVDPVFDKEAFSYKVDGLSITLADASHYQLVLNEFYEALMWS